ncbi:MAG: complex I subunit 4 family protein, partial [Actinomycetota bacterium]
MEWLDGWGLSLATFLPIIGAVVLLAIPAAQDQLVKMTALVFSGAALVIGILLVIRFDYGNAGDLQFETNLEWIKQIGSRYHIGVDGISFPMFVLSLLVSFLCVIYLFWHVPEPGKPKALLALVLLLETGMTGTFIALDLILFFIFFEVVLVPMY